MRIIRLFNSQEGNSFENKVKNTLDSLIKESRDNNIVKLNFYLNSSKADNFVDEYSTISDIIKSVFKKQIPAYTIVSQQHENHNEFSIECQLYSKKLKIKYKSILNHPYVTINHNNGIEVISGGIQFNEDSLLFNTQRSFDFAEQILMAEELNFGHIYRQWNYIPDIYKSSNYDGSDKPNNLVFDEIRNFFYEEPLFTSSYPAETITGCKYGNVTIDFLAFSNHSENIKTIHNIVQENPKEKNATANLVLSKNSTTKYESAKYLKTDNQEIWISSSKSIKDNIAKGSDDIEQQTIETLKSIFDLIDPDNITKNDIQISSQKQLNKQFKNFKVYVKNISDIKKVKEIVSGTLPDIKILVVNADLSLENLLVEMEGLIINTNS